jgi:hypothetical protein
MTKALTYDDTRPPAPAPARQPADVQGALQHLAQRRPGGPIGRVASEQLVVDR